MVNEEVSKESIQFAIRISQFTAQEVMKGMDKTIEEYKQLKKYSAQQPKHGKQSVKELIGQGQGVTSVDIEKTDLKDFQRIAKKYGVDFAVVKDKNSNPPIYTIFFKAKDQDAITNVIKDYTAKKMLKPKKERPSVLEKLADLKKLVASIPTKVAERRKEKSR